MSILKEIANCGGIGNYRVETYISVNYAEAQEQFIANGNYNVFNWHKLDDDFTAPTIESSRESGTSDKTNGKRLGVQVDTITETDVVTVNEEFSSSLLQEVYAIGLETDDYLVQAMSCGLNIMRLTYFPSGKLTRKTYFGSACADLPRVFESVFDGDAQYTLTLTHNNSPIIENIGFSPVFPTGVTQPSATLTTEINATTLTVTVAEVNLGSDLSGDTIIMNTGAKMLLYTYGEYTPLTLVDEVAVDITETSINAVFSDVNSGEYVVVLSGLMVHADNTDYYYNMESKKVSVS